MLALLALGAPAAAQSAGSGDPPPGEESGRTDTGDGGDSTLRVIGRDALFVPKVLVDIALAPVRAGLWAFERYQLDELYYRIFFNRARTIGITPTFGYESGYGVNGVTGGARFVDRDLFGEREHIAIVAATGVVYKQIYSLELQSGDRFGKDFQLQLDAGFEQRPQDLFWGIGNGDVATAPAMPIDPRVDPTAVLALYRQQRMRLAFEGDGRVWRSLHVRGGASVSDVSFDRSDRGTPIDMTYDTTGLVGWNGMQTTYGEVEVRWDDRRRVTDFEPRSIIAAGRLAAVYAGREHVIEGGNDFWRYGADLQQFIRIAEGPRVLALRLHGEGVTGSRDDVPFIELPRLGGLTYLRGYPLDRFRDRVAAFGSVEYEWDLGPNFAANVFVDAGRVYPSLSELTLDHLRVGYGVGIELHTDTTFMLEGSIASSIDGGLLFNLTFNPVFDIDERVRRR